ncbi:enoyl-CoA hydratase [Aliidongia dinghuensis]|uniref:Enoyl-CoA hydratase n=1 Tax=Aliidongia dinghuensis TaxID=1867774 RepID=A0A8J2Z1T7_9PROT|nr:enoyl-CoA hydratase-related protein [Aliidongia dinghuensis]GGF51541.1 enoyl-CoA hydratase [Aliidongia dinghuensis]
MTEPFVLVERDAAIVTVVMNEPETRNALSRTEQCDEMIDALDAVNRDPDVKVLVLTGAGSVFCAGGNIKDMEAKQGFMAGTPDEIGERYRHSLQRLAKTLYGLEVPTIAAVNGPAMGAGLDLACMCDMRIASERARFSETFVRLGLISGIGGAWFLPRAIGHARAAEMAFSGRIIDADTALAYGLVSEVLPVEALRNRANALAAELAANSGVALRYAKRLLRLSERSELTVALDATAALQTIAHLTEGHRMSVERYLEEQRVRRAAGR